jgi:uncharacterized membrane protein YeaQ/YmgE (transglycosylase-associated protein family)
MEISLGLEAVIDPHNNRRPETSEPFPIYTILSFIAPIVISVFSFAWAYHQDWESFGPIIMFWLGTAGSAVAGIVLGVAGLSRREEGAAAALLPIVLGVIVLFLVAWLFFRGRSAFPVA